MSKEMRLDGRVAFVTGGASGIGEAYSRMLAQRGAKVVINGNYRPEGVGPEDALARQLRDKGHDAIGVNGSVTSEDAVQSMIAKAVKTFGRLDIVINNAGHGGIKTPVYELPGPTLDDQIDLHVNGALRVTRAAWPHLQASGTGRILNVGSSGAFGYAGADEWNGTYSVAKGAMFSVTRQMAGAGASTGIKANMVLPWSYSPLIARGIGPTPLGQWIKTKLDPMMIPRATLLFLHQDCPTSGQFFSTGGGRIARILFSSTRGFYDPDLEPEDVLANWNAIFGGLDEAGDLTSTFEVEGQHTEYAVFRSVVV